MKVITSTYKNIIVFLLLIVAGFSSGVIIEKLKEDRFSRTDYPAPTPTSTFSEKTIEPTPIIPIILNETDLLTLKNVNGFTIKYPKKYKAVPHYGIMWPDYIDETNADRIIIELQWMQWDSYSNSRIDISVADSLSKLTLTGAKTLKEYVYETFQTNTKATNTLYVRTILRPREIIFKNEKAFEYKVESKGVFGGGVGFSGLQGIIRVIIQERNGKVFFIAYYDTPELNAIINTLQFD